MLDRADQIARLADLERLYEQTAFLGDPYTSLGAVLKFGKERAPAENAAGLLLKFVPLCMSLGVSDPAGTAKTHIARLNGIAGEGVKRPSPLTAESFHGLSKKGQRQLKRYLQGAAKEFATSLMQAVRLDADADRVVEVIRLASLGQREELVEAIMGASIPMLFFNGLREACRLLYVEVREAAVAARRHERQERLAFNNQTLTITLDNHDYRLPNDPKTFEVYKFLAERDGVAMTAKTIQTTSGIAGIRGEKTLRTLRSRLGHKLKETWLSGKPGHWIVLPPLRKKVRN